LFSIEKTIDFFSSEEISEGPSGASE